MEKGDAGPQVRDLTPEHSLSAPPFVFYHPAFQHTGGFNKIDATDLFIYLFFLQKLHLQHTPAWSNLSNQSSLHFIGLVLRMLTETRMYNCDQLALFLNWNYPVLLFTTCCPLNSEEL